MVGLSLSCWNCATVYKSLNFHWSRDWIPGTSHQVDALITWLSSLSLSLAQWLIILHKMEQLQQETTTQKIYNPVVRALMCSVKDTLNQTEWGLKPGSPACQGNSVDMSMEGVERHTDPLLLLFCEWCLRLLPSRPHSPVFLAKVVEHVYVKFTKSFRDLHILASELLIPKILPSSNL